jgi:hypothetical protein
MKKRTYKIDGHEIPITDMEHLEEFIESEFSTDILYTLDRNRPYDGQPWTDDGIRGRQEVKGLTMRDIKDCFIKACYESAPIPESQYPKSIYDLPWNDIDIIAVQQNLSGKIEKYMGIFPNIPKKEKTNDKDNL